MLINFALDFCFGQSTSQILTRGATQRAKIQTRAMVNKDTQNKTEENGKKSAITLNEAKKKARNSATRSNNDVLVKDIYQNVSEFIDFFLLFSIFNFYFCTFSPTKKIDSDRRLAHSERNVAKLVSYSIEEWPNIVACGTMAILNVPNDSLVYSKGINQILNFK